MRACVAVLSALVLAAAGTAQDRQGTKPQGQQRNQKAAAPEQAKPQGVEPQREKIQASEPQETGPQKAVEALGLFPAEDLRVRARIQVVDLPMNVGAPGNRLRLGRLARRVAFVNGLPPPDTYTAKVPAAQDGLTEIEQALQAARAAGDLQSVLESLDRMERAIMKTRAALHDTTRGALHDADEAKAKTGGKAK